MKSEIKIYLMRHGLDDETYIGGWSPGSLIKEGIKQAEQAANYIFKNINDIKIIYHSGLNRALETAEIVNKKLDLPIFVLDDLKELNKGKLNGLNVSLAKEKYPDFFPTPAINQNYPEGESLLDLYYRVKNFLENIDDYDQSLFVTHRGFINMLYFILNNLEPNNDKNKFDVIHGSIHILEFKSIKKIY